MTRINLAVQFEYDNRFTSQEVVFHLRRAINEYFSRLFDDDDEDGIQLMEIWDTMWDHNPKVANADIDRLFGGNS